MVAGSKNDTNTRPDSAPAEDVPKLGVGGADKKPQPDTDTSSPSGPRSAGLKPGLICPECEKPNSGKWYRHRIRDGDYTCDSCYRFYKLNNRYKPRQSPEAAPSGARASTDGTEAGTTTGPGSTTKSSKQPGAGGPPAKRPGSINQKLSETAGDSYVDKGSAVGLGAKRKLLSEQDAGPRQKRAKHDPDQVEQDVSMNKEPKAEGQPGQAKPHGQSSKTKAEGQTEKLRKVMAKRTSHDGVQLKTSPPLNHCDSPPVPMIDSASCAEGGSNIGGDKSTDLAAVAPMTIKPERSSANTLANIYPKRRAAAVAAARGIAECSGKGNRGLKSGSHAVTVSGSGQAAAPGSMATGGLTDGDGKPQGVEGAGGAVKVPGGQGAGPNSKAQGGSSVLAGAAAVSVAKRIAMMKAAGELKCVICGNLESRRWCKHRQKLEGVTCERCDDYFRRHGFYSTKFKKDALVQQSAAAAAAAQMAAAVEGVAAAKEQVAEPRSVPNPGKPAAPAVQEGSPNAGDGAAVKEEAREPSQVEEEILKEETDVKLVSDTAPAAGTEEGMKLAAAMAGEESPAFMSAIADEVEKEDQEDDAATTEAAAEATTHKETDSAGQEYEIARPELLHEAAPMIATILAEDGNGASDAARPIEMNGNEITAEQEAERPDRGAVVGDEQEEDGKALQLVESLTATVHAAPAEGEAVTGAIQLGASKLYSQERSGISEPQALATQEAPMSDHQHTKLLNRVEGLVGAIEEAAGAEPPAGRGQKATGAFQDASRGQAAAEPVATSAGRTEGEVVGAEAASARSAEGVTVDGITITEANGGGDGEGGKTALEEAAMDPGDVGKEGPREKAVIREEATAGAVDVEADQAAECAEAAAVGDTATRRMDPPHAGLATTRIQVGVDVSGSEAQGKVRLDGFSDAAHTAGASEETVAKLPPTKRAGLRRQNPKQQRLDKKQEEDKHDEKQDRQQEGTVDKKQEEDKEMEAKAATGRDNEQPKAALGNTAKLRTSAGGAGKSVIAEPAARIAAPAAAPSGPAGSAKDGSGTGERTCAACGSNRTQSGWRRHQGGEVGKVVCKRCYDWHYRHGTYERAPAAQRTAPGPASSAATGTSSIVAALRRPRKAPSTASAGATEQAAKGGAGDGAAATTPAAAPASDAVPGAELAMTAATGDDMEPPRKRQKRQRVVTNPGVPVSGTTGGGAPSIATGSAEIMTAARVSRDGGAGVQRKDPRLISADRSLRTRPAEGQADASGAASYPETVADPAVLQSYLRTFCDALARACKALVELEDQYGIRLLDIPAPLSASPAATQGDGHGTVTLAATENPMPPGRSALRLLYERVCGSDTKLRSRHLADVLIRWLELNVWRSPLTMLLGPAASDLLPERGKRLNGLGGDTQVPSKSHPAATPAFAIAVPRLPSATAAASDRFRQVVENLALNMAQNLLGLLPPAAPRPRSASTEGNTVLGSTAAAFDSERDASTPAKGMFISEAHAASMPHLESAAAAALHLANRVAAAPGRLALRLVAPGDPIFAATTATTAPSASGHATGPLSKRKPVTGSMGVTRAQPSAASGGSYSAITAVEWVRCDAVPCDMETAGLGKEAHGDPGRHLRLAYLLRSVYSGGMAQWEDSNVALSMEHPSGGSGGVVAGGSAPAVLWMVSPGIVRRELRMDAGHGGVTEVVVPTVTECGASRLDPLPARPSGIDVLPPVTAPPPEAVTAQLESYVGDNGQAMEVTAAAEAADAVCAAVAKAVARGDHDALLGATEAAAAVVLQLVRAMSKEGFPAKTEQEVEAEVVDGSGKVAASAAVLKEGGFERLARDGLPSVPANVQQPTVVVVEEPFVPALVIGCSTGP
ncbi:hypothetical protein Vretimale_2083 [Volvox reticuliferus]|uniref:Uncharacterized protein n=1 Tax=Volvox reticuliferus TaxID=1737510 RepID=A0A8J4C4D6_9CHLO|nr:hypothetical protein Vretifemale_4286 [Volvox reticuliferus]GIL96221.1 hypothetical protein Vretimale_2083 [Volvox reticuliferus]